MRKEVGRGKVLGCHEDTQTLNYADLSRYVSLRRSIFLLRINQDTILPNQGLCYHTLISSFNRISLALNHMAGTYMSQPLKSVSAHG